MTLSYNDIMRRAAWLLFEHWPIIALAVATLSGLGLLVDLGIVQTSSFNTVVNGATLAFQYGLTRTLLKRLGYPDPSGPRGLAFIGLGILSGLAILLGVVLLIIPGLILIVRWSIADACLLSSDEGVTECLRESWRQTDGQFWPIFMSLLTVYSPALVFGLGGFALGEWGDQPYAGSIIAEVAINLAIVGGWVATVAVFTFLNRSPALADIFE